MPLPAIIGGATALIGGAGSLIGGNNAQGEIRTGLKTATSALSPYLATGTGANNLIAQLLGVKSGPVGGSGFAGGPGSLGFRAGINPRLASLGLDNMYGVEYGSPQGGAYSGYQGAGGVGNPTGGGAGGNPLDVFFKSAGGQFILDRGSRAITANNAASGLLNSGSTLKALTEFGQNVGSTFFTNFLNQLQFLATGGLNAGIGISNAATGAASNLADLEIQKVSGLAEAGGGILGAIPTG